MRLREKKGLVKVFFLEQPGKQLLHGEQNGVTGS